MPRRRPDRPHIRIVAQGVDQALIRHVAIEHQDGRIVEPDQLVDLLPQALVPVLDVAIEQAVIGQVFDEKTLLTHDPDRLRQREEHRLQRLRAASRDGEHAGQMADADAVRGHEQDPPLATRDAEPRRIGAAGRSDLAGARRAPRGRTAARPAPGHVGCGERTRAGRHGAGAPARGPRRARHRSRRRRTGSGNAAAGSPPRRSPWPR